MVTRILAEGFLLFILGGAVVLFYAFIFKKVNKADEPKVEPKTKDSKTNGSE